MKIFFDMDGTIANLYGVENWLEYIIARNEKPYLEAEVMLNMNALARRLNTLKNKGYEIGIISWLAKNSTDDYDEKVTNAKKTWLKKHLASVKFDTIEIVKYGYAKETFITGENDILFDDEKPNRDAWTGKAYTEKEIMKVLKKL